MSKPTINAAPGAELPLTPVKRDKMEGDLLRWLTNNNCVAGGLMFCARTEKFVMLRLTKDVEDLMPQHCETLRTKARDLGKRRSETMPIYHKDDLGASYARVFSRVLKGCTEAQIAAALQYLNDQMEGCPSEQKFCKYDEMATLCRDVLVPGFKMFTRKTKYKPWSWFPILNDSPIVCLADMVVDGDKTKAIDVTEEVTAKRAGYPAIELVRRETSGEGVASTSGTIVRRKQDGEMRTLNTGTETDLRRQDEESNETVNKDKDGKPDENDFPNDDEVLLDHVEQQEKLNEEPVQSAACPQAHDKDEANERKVDHDIAEQKTEKTIQVANKGQVQDGDKIGVEVFEPSFDTTNRDDEDHDDEVPDPEQSEPKDKPAKQTLNVDKAFSEINDKSSKEIRDEIDVMSELPVDKLPKGGEPIISGNIGGANAEDMDEEDTRPLSLRRLQSMLPKSEEEIPDPTSDRLNFTRLVYELRPYLLEHYKQQNIKTELEPVTLTKLLNLRQCSKELKRILQHMEERDLWILDRQEKRHRKRQRAIKFQNTLKGRQMEKKRLEDVEFDRLRNKGPPITSTQINASQSGTSKQPPRMQRNTSTASSSSHVERPLMTLLGKHSQPRTSDYASHEAAEGNQNVSFMSEAGNISQILDIPDDKMPSFDGTFIRPASGTRGFVKTDTLRVMKDMYVLMQDTIRLGQNREKTNESVLKNVEKSMKDMDKKMKVMGQQVRVLSKAFFDYDLEANQDLITVENELMAYFPLNELGEKTDFLLTNPVCAKTITKHVKNSLFDDKSNVSELTEVVRKTAIKCFSLELRAHMNLIKRKVKQSYPFAGWHYVKCPTSFQDLIRNYTLCLCSNLNPTEKQRGWLSRLSDHLRNAGTTYFNYSGTSTITQAEYVKNRYYERRRLQDKHFDPEVEGRDLKIPSVEQEIEHYANKSQKCEEEDMESSNKSQRSGKNDKNTAGKPLPDLAALVDLSKRIDTAMKACIVARKGQKRKMALEHHGVDRDDSSDGSLPCPNRFPGKKVKFAWKGADFEFSSNDDDNDDVFVSQTKAGTDPPAATVTSASTSASAQAAAVDPANLVRASQSKLSLKKKFGTTAQSQP